MILVGSVWVRDGRFRSARWLDVEQLEFESHGHHDHDSTTIVDVLYIDFSPPTAEGPR
ncbi:hypothetical protein BD779DRAFT_1562508 [Infundibulicybe gibba]|nr:hypothetical protein BD779DRAFT_1562508 [Infundibulicybe gibba]